MALLLNKTCYLDKGIIKQESKNAFKKAFQIKKNKTMKDSSLSTIGPSF